MSLFRFRKETHMNTKQQKNLSILEWLETLSFSMVVIVLLFTFVIRVVTVSGLSMEPTLNGNERVAVYSLFYTPQRQDIIVIDGYTQYGEPLVKRVIGVAGDKVNIDFENGIVFINDKPLSEPYVSDATYRQGDTVFPLVVPENCVFVLGDNRPRSMDGRDSQIGLIDTRDILGKAIFRIFPFNKLGAVG